MASLKNKIIRYTLQVDIDLNDLLGIAGEFSDTLEQIRSFGDIKQINVEIVETQ